MIKKVSVDFPDFGVKASHEFGPGVNLLEEKNGYGKTTLLNAILSLYTGKFGTQKIPNGTASIETDSGSYLLSKGLWVGKSEEPNALVRYVMPGAFFDLSTPDQRMAVVKLLDFDYEGWMKEREPSWTPTLKTELNKKVAMNAGREDVILEDVTKLRSAIIQYEKDPVTVVDNTNEIETAYRNSVKDYEDARLSAISSNNKVRTEYNQVSASLDNALAQRDRLKVKYDKAKASTTCLSCSQTLPKEAYDSSLRSILEEGKNLNVVIAEYEKRKSSFVEAKVPDPLPTPTLEEKAVKVGSEIRKTSQEDLMRLAAYQSAKRELVSKENDLRALGELEDAKVLEAVKAAEFSFTQELQGKIDMLGLEIELFKTQKNGDIKETFAIFDGGIPYSELSNGRKALVQFKLANAFADKLGLDFLLLDEAGTISKETLAEIVSASGGKQVILTRAIPFAKKDIN